MDILLNEIKFKVHKIKKVENGVQISLSSSNRISVISKDGKATVFGLEECEKVLLGIQC